LLLLAPGPLVLADTLVMKRGDREEREKVKQRKKKDRTRTGDSGIE